MSSFWVNFAATGDPNGNGLPKWPIYREDDDMAMSFGDEIAVKPLPHKVALDFMDKFFARMRASGQLVPIR
jgi:para-nitrobenzyl esterase